MNQDLQLQLQSHLDAELSPTEARRIEELLVQDIQAKAIYDELNATRQALRGGELELKLPESRDFYWSKIAREIAKEERAASPSRPAFRIPWARWLIPSAGFALLVGAVVVSSRIGSPARMDLAALSSEATEVETPLEESSLIAFRSEAEGLSVVWVDTR